MRLGLSYKETLRGIYYPLAEPTDERPMECVLNVRVGDLATVVRHKQGRVEGELTMAGFADSVPLTGTVGFRLFDQRRVPYDLSFTANDGQLYSLRGQRELRPVAPTEWLTVLPASVYDRSGRELLRVSLRGDLRADAKRLLRSLRLTFGDPGVSH